MTKPTKPVIHNRDHEHGGADPVRIVYESVGGEGEPGTGIQFDVVNTGDWLEVDTTGDNAGVGQLFYATSQLQLFSDDEITIGGHQILLSSQAGGIALDGGTAGNITITVGSGFVIMHGLPSSDPGTTGALWNNSGTLSIS